MCFLGKRNSEREEQQKQKKIFITDKKINDLHAVMVTAQSSDDGYVLRYFAPKIGISEDLATGSAQCSLAPYWFDKLGKDKLSVRQLSSAGGYFEVEKGANSSIVVSARVECRQ